jgi:nicotinamidase-related amidase
VARGGSLPVHCVADSPGAELHPALNQAAIHKTIDKGVDPDSDGTSAFDGTGLSELLHDRGISKVTIVGLGTDQGIRATALDAVDEGFDVELDTEAVRGLSVQPGDDERAIAEMLAAGVTQAR